MKAGCYTRFHGVDDCEEFDFACVCVCACGMLVLLE